MVIEDEQRNPAYPLLLTCKAVCTEVRPSLYDNTRFVFNFCDCDFDIVDFCGNHTLSLKLSKADFLRHIRRLEFKVIPACHTIQDLASSYNGLISSLNAVAKPSAILFTVEDLDMFLDEAEEDDDDEEDLGVVSLVTVFKKVTCTEGIVAKYYSPFEEDHKPHKGHDQFKDIARMLRAKVAGLDHEV